MNTTLKPALPTASQTSATTPSKSMHPQGAPMSYSQPSGAISQNSFPNTNVAHSHTSSQQNHFNVNTSGSYNMGTIPASNHPVANISQTSIGQQSYNPPKNVSYSSGYQVNLGNTQNQNTVPPVSQALPATPQQTTVSQQNVSSPSQNATSSNLPTEHNTEKEVPQANGTAENKSQTNSEVDVNHVTQPPAASGSPPLQASQVPSATPKQEESSATATEKTHSPKTPQDSLPQASKDPEDSAATVSEPTTSPNDSHQPDSESTVSETVKEAQEKDPLAIEEAEEMTEEVPQQKTGDILEHDEGDAETQETTETSASGDASDPEKQTVKKEARTPARKPKTSKQEPKTELKTPVQKSPNSGKTKRQRIRTQHYQSPLPEIEIITKISSSTPKSKNVDDKLIYFYKNEFLAVRNAEGSFYLCQAVQNIYKSSTKIKIRWLSQDKSDKSGEIYTPDFYDLTDFDCILTSIELTRVDKGKYRLKPAEKERTDSILKRCLAVEKGEIASPSVSEEHPDGLDLSLYKDEEQLKKKRKTTKRKGRPRSTSPKKETPTKKSPEARKVRKVEPKPANKAVKNSVAKKVSNTEVKKGLTNSSRATRGKRKSDTKTSPVVDQKKALVLARIGKKAAISVSNNRSQNTDKVSKSSRTGSKAIASTSKVAPSTSKTAPSTSKTTKSPASSAKAAPPKKSKRSSKK